MDKIILKQLQFYGYHGLFPEENRLGQRFLVDAELFTSLRKAGKSDDMHDSINYGQAFDIIRQIIEGEPKNLIEAVADSVAEALFKTFPSLNGCVIRVVKPDPPIPGQYDSVAVEIERQRG